MAKDDLAKKKSDGLHKGHRERIKEKYLKDNFDNMEPHEMLEMLLYYAIPRRDTNPIAHRLIDEFGSISAVFDASMSSLMEFGLSKNTAILIKSIPDFSRLYSEDKQNVRHTTMTMDMLPDFFRSKFIGRTEEVLYCALMDGNFNLLRCELLSKGSINSTDVPVRKIVESSLLHNAKFVAIAHNHPLGLPIPSKADLNTTRLIRDILMNMNIVLIDHVIISADDYMSLANSTFGKNIFK